MSSTDRTLLRLHIEAVWTVQLPAIEQSEVELLPASALPAWKLCVATLADERIFVWRPDVPATERETLLQRVDGAFAFPPPVAAPAGVEREVALFFTDTPRLARQEAQQKARRLTARERKMLKQFVPDVSGTTSQNPLVGVVIDGRIRSLAYSSRRTREACELGVDTLPEERRKGYALAAAVSWTYAILQEGLVPLYSTSNTNEASLNLATAAGYQRFAQVALFTE